MNIRDFIDDIDCDDDILNIEYNGHLVWPIIRFQVIQQVINFNNNISDPKLGETKGIKSLLIGIVYGIIYFPLRSAKNSILIFSNTLSLYLTENKKYKNKLFDYFIAQLPIKRIVFFEESNSDYKHKPNKELKSKLFSKNLITFGVEILIKLKHRFDKKEVNVAQNRITQIFEVSQKHILVNCNQLTIENLKEIENSLVKQLLRATFLSKFYNIFFFKQSHQIVFHEDGHYGGDKALINYYAHKSNKTVIEPQHGFINRNHPAYYFGKKFCENKIVKKYFPDYFLTYGKFWSNSAQVPNSKIEIGNPHLETISKSLNAGSTKNKCILIIGSGVNVNQTNELLQTALKNSNGYEIKYRPHPQEISLHLNRYSESYKQGLQLDSDSLYTSLNSCEILIAEMSTVLFEALLFCNNVFLYKSSYTNAYYDESIKYFNEIEISNFRDIFSIKSSSYNKEAIDYYWTTKWDTNFCNFLNSIKQ
ncbi:hypothetical protein [Sediminibacterium sp.]|uniref:hypothetical protein n=1 Tax=Sediminibacterium sp. TaxID=1917865 RepID=UPI0025F00E04|nr:hypothetical protein [Sediminibacterium sp.]